MGEPFRPWPAVPTPTPEEVYAGLSDQAKEYFMFLEASLRQDKEADKPEALDGIRWDWPFSFELPLLGYSTCPIFEESGHIYTPPSAVAAAAGPAAAAPKVRRYEFYYSTEVAPGEQYPTDINTALSLLKRLESKGVEVKVTEVKAGQDMFPVYHKAITGPDVSVRSVFGTKGALEPEFGRQVPALLVLEGTDRYPVEVFPRMDAKASRLIGVEEALEAILAPAMKEVPVPVVAEENNEEE